MKALDPITRFDFQRLSEIRRGEATALLAARRFEGVYYLIGYAVECALKACICRRHLPDHFPPRPEVVQTMYSHDLSKLLALAGLDKVLDASVDATLIASWAITKDWKEQSRYNFPGQTEAEQLYTAVLDPTHGVLPWLHQHW